MEELRSSVEEEQRLGKLARIGRFVKDKGRIGDMKQKLDEALASFMVGTVAASPASNLISCIHSLSPPSPLSGMSKAQSDHFRGSTTKVNILPRAYLVQFILICFLQWMK